jgi:hypothetical protein
MSDAQRVPSMLVGVDDARPYGIAGVAPSDAKMTAHRPHGQGRLYVSDVPYAEPYNDRQTCEGRRTDGHDCNAKAKPGERFCSDHDPHG